MKNKKTKKKEKNKKTKNKEKNKKTKKKKKSFTSSVPSPDEPFIFHYPELAFWIIPNPNAGAGPHVPTLLPSDQIVSRSAIAFTFLSCLI